jgi:plastocyanin
VEGAASPISSPAPATSSSAAAANISITPDRRFDPPSVAIGRGQSILWRNTSRNPQTVTCDPARVADPSRVTLPPGAEPFDSGVINPNSTFFHTFTVAGDYQYISLPFEAFNMTGEVTAQ